MIAVVILVDVVIVIVFVVVVVLDVVDAFSHFFRRVCLSVRPWVGPSVRR